MTEETVKKIKFDISIEVPEGKEDALARILRYVADELEAKGPDGKPHIKHPIDWSKHIGNSPDGLRIVSEVQVD